MAPRSTLIETMQTIQAFTSMAGIVEPYPKIIVEEKDPKSAACDLLSPGHITSEVKQSPRKDSKSETQKLSSIGLSSVKRITARSFVSDVNE